MIYSLLFDLFGNLYFIQLIKKNLKSIHIL